MWWTVGGTVSRGPKAGDRGEGREEYHFGCMRTGMVLGLGVGGWWIDWL